MRDELRRLQESFQAFLLHKAAGIETLVAGEDAAQRLAIYADAYRLRLEEALGANYPKLRRILGDEVFRRLGLGYLREFPSRDPNIRWFGSSLAGFLDTAPPWSGQPVLAEMARFEWTLTEVFDAPDAPLVGPETIAGIPAGDWPGLRFVPHPSARRLDLEWTVPQLWSEIEDHGERQPAPPTRSADPLGWLLWRREFGHYWRSLSVDEAWALDAIDQGASMGELCEGLCEWIDPGNVPGRAAEMVRRWVADGLISSLLP